jgi:hypothetical protein
MIAQVVIVAVWAGLQLVGQTITAIWALRLAGAPCYLPLNFSRVSKTAVANYG